MQRFSKNIKFLLLINFLRLVFCALPEPRMPLKVKKSFLQQTTVFHHRKVVFASSGKIRQLSISMIGDFSDRILEKSNERASNMAGEGLNLQLFEALSLRYSITVDVFEDVSANFNLTFNKTLRQILSSETQTNFKNLNIELRTLKFLEFHHLNKIKKRPIIYFPEILELSDLPAAFLYFTAVKHYPYIMMFRIHEKNILKEKVYTILSVLLEDIIIWGYEIKIDFVYNIEPCVCDTYKTTDVYRSLDVDLIPNGEDYNEMCIFLYRQRI